VATITTSPYLAASDGVPVAQSPPILAAAAASLSAVRE
jgi:hypothetical protein